jgi:hypothetical protein
MTTVAGMTSTVEITSSVTLNKSIIKTTRKHSHCNKENYTEKERLKKH